MPTIDSPIEFASALTDEKDTVQTFIALLQKEQEALIQGHIDEVDFIASDKARLVEKLTHLGEQRNQYLLTQGVSTDSAGMEKLLAMHHSKAPELKTIWAELRQLAELAQQTNKNNGVIIASLMQHNQRTFDALQSAAGNISLYGPKGQAFV